MYKKLLFIILILLIFLFNGCWDRRELESLGIVQTLGLDKGPEGKELTITTMIAIPPLLGNGGESGGGGGGGGGGAETGVFTISMSAPTIYEALNRLNTTINREITLMQNSAILIGEDLAKDGIGEWADTFVRFREMRRTILVFITKGKAAEVMKVQPKIEKNPAEYFVDLAKQSNVNGMFPISTLNDLISNFEAQAREIYVPLIEKYQPMEPVPAKKEEAEQPNSTASGVNGDSGNGGPPSKDERIRIIGTAVFRGDKMVGNLDTYESQAFLLLSGQFREAMLSLTDYSSPDNYIVFRLLAATGPNIKYSHRKNKDFFSVKFNLEADILSIQSGSDFTIPSKEVLLGKIIAKNLKNRMKKVIAKVQQQYKSDIFGFGIKAQSTFVTSTAWEKYKWPEKFPDAKIDISVKVDIRRVGVQFQPPKLR